MFVTNKLAIGTAVTTLSLLLTAQTSVKASTFAGIPIEEEFIVSQWTYVDSSFDSIVTVLFEEGLLDTQSVLSYNGAFNVFQDSNGDFFGDISGNLSGMYLGEEWSIDYLGNVTTEIIGNPEKQLKTSFTSSGKWKRGPFAGKKFTDKGTLIEKENNKANLELEITNEGDNKPVIKTTIPDLDKKKDPKKKELTVKGKVTIETEDKNGKKKTREQNLKIVLDQDKKTGTSEVKSFGFLVLKNDCKFTVDDNPKPQIFDNGLTFFSSGSTMCDLDVKTVPEPTSIISFVALGTLGAASTLKRKLKPSKSPEKDTNKVG